MGESTEAVSNGVFDELTLSKLFVLDDLKELSGELGHHGVVLGNASVVNEIAPEAQNVEELLLGELSEALELVGPVCFRASVNTSECLVLELLYELSGELHSLGGDTAHLSHLVLDLFKVLLINIIGRFGLLDECPVGRLKRRHKVESILENWLQSIDLLLVEELRVLLVFATHGAQVVSEGLDEDLGGLVVVTSQSLLELLNVHGEGLLEELDVLGLTDSDQHRLEDLQSVLSDGLAVVIGHMLGDNG